MLSERAKKSLIKFGSKRTPKKSAVNFLGRYLQYMEVKINSEQKKIESGKTADFHKLRQLTQTKRECEENLAEAIQFAYITYFNS